MANLSGVAQTLLTIQGKVADHQDSGDFMIGAVLGMLLGSRAPSVAAGFLAAYAEACGADEQRILSALTDQLLSAASPALDGDDAARDGGG